ncbi:MAG: glycosyltransferase [Flavobacteriales bacterium]|nr:glycosyltransferase [Flavobacteriales bacterium]
MKLSVIIVNYNVKHFLEQCLTSVMKAKALLKEVEVVVVDNNSVDGSLEMLAEKFPNIKLIANKDNKGFSSANNQGIEISTGEYVLLLNPDTIVEEDTFLKTVGFMDETPNAGGLGVKMIDGKGNFLPESKRGLPTPWAAFCKMTGFARLFPKSKTFNRYHLGYLDKEEIHEVEILSGAFMLLRRTALDRTGLLDETFFMYGEDIDLSYRLVKEGFENYYYPKTCIIHYKGESTRKGSLNYVFIFYNAMVIFANKHFSENNAKLFGTLIKAAIYLRASLSILRRLLSRLMLPALDAGLIFTSMVLIQEIWEKQVMMSEGPYYPIEFITIAVPTYILIWLSAIYLSGGYDKPVRTSKSIQGIVLGTLLILVVYALIPESWRFSRALILLGAVAATLSTSLLRILLKLVAASALIGDQEKSKNAIIIGNEAEASRVVRLLEQAVVKPVIKGWISTEPQHAPNLPSHLGMLGQLGDVVQVHKVDEIVFCIKDLPISQIINQMASLGARKLEYKIAPPESMHIIGSSAINTAEDLYMIELSTITKLENQRNKRLLDLISGICMVVLSPLLVFISGNPLRFFTNTFSVLLGIKSWVGYIPHKNVVDSPYPKIKEGVLNPSDALKKTMLTDDEIHDLNLRYAKDYSIRTDILIIRRGMLKLGRK